MDSTNESIELSTLLNEALAREVHVSTQYMLQHAIWNVQSSATPNELAHKKQAKFIGDHKSFWLPGSNLKRIAITEMRHAESIAERIVQLGGEPVIQQEPLTLGNTVKEILEIDKGEETEAIQLYNQIISLAKNEKDDITRSLFEKILIDEEKHLEMFSSLLKEF